MIIVSQNWRRLIHSRPTWVSRRGNATNLLGRVMPDIMTCQETTTLQRVDLSRMGKKYPNATMHGKVGILATSAFKITDVLRTNLPSPASNTPRRLCVVVYDDSFAVATTHLTVHTSADATWQKRQAEAIVKAIGRFGSKIVLTGDMNTSSTVIDSIMGTAGLVDMRTFGVNGSEFASHDGYGKRIQSGKWLDRIYLGSGMLFQSGKLVTHDASDHNMLCLTTTVA